MIVIRCENPANPTAPIGPSRHGLRWDHLPCPQDDGFDWGHPLWDIDWNCAALPEQLDHWFGPAERERLRAAGFRFSVLECEPLHVGTRQAIIDRKNAKLVGEYLQ